MELIPTRKHPSQNKETHLDITDKCTEALVSLFKDLRSTRQIEHSSVHSNLARVSARVVTVNAIVLKLAELQALVGPGRPARIQVLQRRSRLRKRSEGYMTDEHTDTIRL